MLLEAVGPQRQKVVTFSDGRVTINGQLTTRATSLDDANGIPVPGSFVHQGTIENLCETLA